eukprot:GHVO01040731.1.p2 GENE.GHVO01040731.1~~GHVO01040731.1.p2  ORF type:complete len:116 (-),score=5.01 GHVO01040731.1:1523-1870(-)
MKDRWMQSVSSGKTYHVDHVQLRRKVSKSLGRANGQIERNIFYLFSKVVKLKAHSMMNSNKLCYVPAAASVGRSDGECVNQRMVLGRQAGDIFKSKEPRKISCRLNFSTNLVIYT